MARVCVKSRFTRLCATIPRADGFLHDNGGHNRGKKLGPEPTEKGGGKAKKAKKAKTKTWSDMVKGLMKEDELETANSEKERQRIRDS